MARTKEFKLPKYLKLAKGSMWFDTEGPNCSGIELRNSRVSYIGREPIYDDEYIKSLEDEYYTISKPVPKDKFDNKNDVRGGYIDAPKEHKWYFDTSVIPEKKRGNIIAAVKYGILVECKPKMEEKKAEQLLKSSETQQKKPSQGDGDFRFDQDGAIIFEGKNKPMYDKISNLDEADIIEFVNKMPSSSGAFYNLQDLLEYENKGYNRVSKPRFNVLNTIRDKLKQYPNGMSPIIKNDDVKDGEIVTK